MHAPSTLAQLCAPTTMPANLAKAHAALDKAVDAASNINVSERVIFLLERYPGLTSLI